MSSEATNLTVATRKQHTLAQYRVFFPKEDAAFWHFVDRGREDFQTQEASPQHSQPSHKPSPGTTGSRLRPRKRQQAGH